MKKNEILDKIEDKDQRKNVAEILDFAEAAAKAASTSPEDIQKAITDRLTAHNIKAESIEGITEFVETKLHDIAEAVKVMQESQKSEKHQTLKNILTAQMPALKAIAEGTNKGMISFMIPKTTITNASVVNNTPGIMQSEIIRPAFALPNMATIMGTLPIPMGNHKSIGYFERTTSTNNAAAVSENGTVTDSAAEWTLSTKQIEKIMAWIPMTKESLYDVEWMNSEIDAFIRENLLTKEDTYLVNGTGTPPQIQGLYDIATAFVASDFASKYTQGNLFNLLLCVASKMSNGLNSKFKATHVVLNDTDFISMLGNQNSFGSYDFPPFARLNGDGTLNVAGMTVVSNSNITANTALVFDVRQQKRYASGIEIEVGYNGNDIIYDRLTMIGRIRECVVIPSQNLLGFYKITDIAADILTIGQSTP